MKILIYSDVHGNLPAFEKMLDHEGECDSYICLGDLVNYGPWSNECVDLALSLPSSSIIMGNHEEAFIRGEYPGSNKLVQSFFERTYPDFDRKQEISNFKNAVKLDKFICAHTINNSYIYPDTKIILKDNYIIGHSHHQFKIQYQDFILYNSGSVGQNRKYINQINYLTYDTELKIILMKSLSYNLNFLIGEMKRKNYPSICIKYYLNKKLI